MGCGIRSQQVEAEDRSLGVQVWAGEMRVVNDGIWGHHEAGP